MDKHIRDQYDEGVLHELAQRYGIDAGEAALLGGFESFVYEYQRDGRAYVLRISHSSRRTAAQIRGEVEWINYLAEHGVPAARAVPSDAGNLVEVVRRNGSTFAATAFVRARGTHARQEDWRPPLFRRLGQVVGRMHALTKSFVPRDPATKRPEWYQESEGFAAARLPPSERAAVGKFDRLVAFVRALPTDRDSYGLVHTDVHRGNFYVDPEGAITLFDFDDCQYSWFADDIAMALFYAVPHDCRGPENLGLARTFFTTFLQGYSSQNAVDSGWFRYVPHFLKLRELAIYAAIHAGFDDLGDLDPWCASFMDGRKARIEGDVPYIDLDFEDLAAQVGCCS